MAASSLLSLYNTPLKGECKSLVFLHDGPFIYTELMPYSSNANYLTSVQEKHNYVIIVVNTFFLLNHYLKCFYINYMYYGKFFIFDNSYCNSGCTVDLNKIFCEYQISSLYGKAYKVLPQTICEDIYIQKFILNTSNSLSPRTFSDWLKFSSKQGAINFYSIFLKFKPEVNKEFLRYTFKCLYPVNSDPTTFYLDLRKKSFDLYWLRSHYFSIKQEKTLPNFGEMQQCRLFPFSTTLSQENEKLSQLDAFIFVRNTLNKSTPLYDYPRKLLVGNSLALEYNFVSYQTILFFFKLEKVKMPTPFYELPKFSFWFVNYQLNKTLTPSNLIENAKNLYFLDLEYRRDTLKSFIRNPLLYLYTLFFFLLISDILYFTQVLSPDDVFKLTSVFFFMKAFFFIFFRIFCDCIFPLYDFIEILLELYKLIIGE